MLIKRGDRRLVSMIIGGVLVVMFSLANGLSVAGGRSHHMKRSQANLPMLTLDVEPSAHGIDPTQHVDTKMPVYRFPVDSGRFNFTCTIRHPVYRYKLTILREQQRSDGKTSSVHFIVPGDYELNPELDNGRTRVEFSEPDFIDPSARFIRVSLILENLKVEDSGIYICKYSNITDKISAVIYRTPKEEDVSWTANPDPVRAGHPATVSCAVSNVYPKPTILLTHSLRVNVQSSVDVQDASQVSDPANPFHLYNMTATYNFTPTYADHLQKFACVAHVQGFSNLSSDTSREIEVYGTQIIDKDCERAVAPKPGETEIRLLCSFFANPRAEASHWEFEEEVIETQPTSETTNSEMGSQEDVVSAAAVSGSDGNNVVNELTSPRPKKMTVQLRENEDNPNYIYKIEENENPQSGVYTAVLTIKAIGTEFLKEYTFKVGDVSKTIKVYADETQKEISLKAEISAASALVSSQFHSIVCTITFFAILRAYFA